MIFNTIYGGNFLKVAAVAALPSTVTERMIVAITSATVTSVIASPERPVGADGRIWIAVKPERPNIISSAGNVDIELVGAWIYTGGAWVKLDAYYAMYTQWQQFSSGATQMGVSWNTAITSPALTRLGDSIGLTAVAGVGSMPGYSDFDTMPIYKDIKKVILPSGDVMVRIPKFYYKVSYASGVWSMYVSDQALTGYTVHPAFARPNGTKEFIYIGAYPTGAGHVSKPGLYPQHTLTRAAFRTAAAARGAGWSQIDIAAKLAVDLLIRIEYATHDVQTAIWQGNVANSAALASGATDSMAFHTGRAAGTDGLVSVQWRGIENWWGNIWQFVDGLNYCFGTLYFCLNPAQFADDTAANYTANTGYTVPTTLSGSYMTSFGVSTNAPWLLIPNVAGGSATTYLCDAMWSSGASAADWRVALFGGDWTNGSVCGLSTLALNYASPAAYASIASRLLYMP